MRIESEFMTAKVFVAHRKLSQVLNSFTGLHLGGCGLNKLIAKVLMEIVEGNGIPGT
jgi:hypothetical protein